ncbi:MAG: hypothetical protein AAGB48_11925 [Planctomycetota bacterium]
MVVTVLYSLLAGFFAWIVLDLVADALLSRLIDPAAFQREKPPKTVVVVNRMLVGVGVAVAIVVFILRLSRST